VISWRNRLTFLSHNPWKTVKFLLENVSRLGGVEIGVEMLRQLRLQFFRNLICEQQSQLIGITVNGRHRDNPRKKKKDRNNSAESRLHLLRAATV
jgi:hypothetical protein